MEWEENEENSRTKSVQPVKRQRTQANRERLLGLYGSRDGRASKDERGKKSEFYSI